MYLNEKTQHDSSIMPTYYDFGKTFYLEESKEKFKDIESSPEWLIETHINNKIEENQSRLHTKRILREYFEKENIIVRNEILESDTTILMTKREKPSFSQIKLISKKERIELNYKQRDKGITEDEWLSCEKYDIRYKYLKSNTDTECFDTVYKYYYQDGSKGELFKNMLMETIPEYASYQEEKETNNRYAEFCSDTHLRNNEIQKIRTAMGWNVKNEDDTYKRLSLDKIEFDSNDVAKKLLPLMNAVGIDKYKKLFKIRTTIKKFDKNCQCITILNSIYNTWSAYEIDTYGKKSIRIDKKIQTIYNYKLRHIKLDEPIYNMLESLPFLRFSD